MEPFGFGALHETLKVPPEINTKEFFRVLDFTTFFCRECEETICRVPPELFKAQE